MSYVALWARAFIITVAIELPIVFVALRGVEPSRVRRVGAALFANLASHPAVWFIVPELGLPHASVTTAEELWAVLVETLIYRLVFPALPWPRALGVSALANGVSYGIGLLLRARGLV